MDAKSKIDKLIDELPSEFECCFCNTKVFFFLISLFLIIFIHSEYCMRIYLTKIYLIKMHVILHVYIHSDCIQKH